MKIVILNLKYESHWSQSITNTPTLYILEHTTTSFPTLLKKMSFKTNYNFISLLTEILTIPEV